MPALPEPISHTITALYDAYAAARAQEEREYLGASIIGEPCERSLFYTFRWASSPEAFDGRMLYLFDTGHVEEARMIAALRAVPGVKVHDRQEDGSQLGFVALGGHFRGHLDGVVTGLLEAPSSAHVLECKTHKAESWRATKKHGVKKAKPTHYAQMQIYGHYFGLTRWFYLFENKDNSQLDRERGEIDPLQGASLVAKAERVIFSPTPLPKLFKNSRLKAAFPCRTCRHLGICHEGGFSRVNCRTCLSSTTVSDGWYCDLHRHPLTVEQQRLGCSAHLFIPGLVPGTQVDADEERRTVTYDMGLGRMWTDGVAG